jgi:hypothetical protein
MSPPRIAFVHSPRPGVDHAAASRFDHAPAEPEACRRPRTCRRPVLRDAFPLRRLTPRIDEFDARALRAARPVHAAVCRSAAVRRTPTNRLCSLRSVCSDEPHILVDGSFYTQYVVFMLVLLAHARRSKGNPANLRGCPAAVIESDLHDSALASCRRTGKRWTVGTRRMPEGS